MVCMFCVGFLSSDILHEAMSIARAKNVDAGSFDREKRTSNIQRADLHFLVDATRGPRESMCFRSLLSYYV